MCISVRLINFIKISQTLFEILLFFIFKMAAVRHLKFVSVVFGPLTKGIWWSLFHCAKFGCDRYNSFDYKV